MTFDIHQTLNNLLGRRTPWRSFKRGQATIHVGEFAVTGAMGLVRHRVPGRIVTWNFVRPAEVYLDRVPRELYRLHIGRCFQRVSPETERVILHWNVPAYDFETVSDFIEEQLRLAYTPT